MESVNLYSEPELSDPSFVAAWPGMGGVAAIAIRHLRDKLGAEEFGRIEPYSFFEPTTVHVQDNILGKPRFPESKFYFVKNTTGNDLIIFNSEAQPAREGYKFANEVLDVAQRFGVKRIYTSAASPAHLHYARMPKVLGAATSAEMLPALRGRGVKLVDNSFITGMNGLLLGVARQRGMEGICLLGEVPGYMTHVAFPRASKAVLEVLGRFLNVTVDVAELDEWIRKADEEVEQHIQELMAFLGEGEEAKRIAEYFERLKELADTEEAALEESPGDNLQELLAEVERFLRRQGRGKGERGDSV